MAELDPGGRKFLSRVLAGLCAAAGKRLVFTSSHSVYFAGELRGTITEDTFAFRGDFTQWIEAVRGPYNALMDAVIDRTTVLQKRLAELKRRNVFRVGMPGDRSSRTCAGTRSSRQWSKRREYASTDKKSFFSQGFLLQSAPSWRTSVCATHSGSAIRRARSHS